MPISPDAPPFVLGDWRVNPQLDILQNGDRSVKLEPRAMRLLCVLANAEGKLVRTEDLLDTVWPQVIVTSGSLYEAIAQLRKILGAATIATVPRKGYRLAVIPSRPPAAVATTAALPASLGPHSLAVLPLRIRQIPAEHAFIRESLLDGLIAELSRHPQLEVVALGTMLSYAGASRLPQEIGQELGAAFVVDGVLELQHDMLAIRIQLVSAQRGTQTWIDALELPLASWWDAAGLVAARLARALNIELLVHATRLSPLKGADDSHALMLASRAWVGLFARPETRDVTAQASTWAQQALALEAGLPMAWVCLAFCCWRNAQFGWGDTAPHPLRLQALGYAERAIALDEREPDAHYVLALVAYSLGQTPRAEESLRHCLRLSGSHAPAHGLLALIRTRRGHPEEAAALCARAFALSPREPLRVVWYLALAWAGLALHDYRAAFEASQQAMAVNPDFGTAYLTGAAAAQQLGAEEEAQQWVAFMRERTVFSSLHAVQERLPPPREPAHRKQMEQLLHLLKAAGLS